MLGVLAQKTGKGFIWDTEKMKTNEKELNAYIKEPVRRGWEMGEELWT